MVCNQLARTQVARGVSLHGALVVLVGHQESTTNLTSPFLLEIFLITSRERERAYNP